MIAATSSRSNAEAGQREFSISTLSAGVRCPARQKS